MKNFGMKSFEYERASSFEEAGELLRSNPDAEVLAGGTDLLSVIRDEIYPDPPSMVIDIKRIEGNNQICVSGDTVRIGALATLAKIAENKDIKEKIPALSEAASTVATPLIRNTGTIGGNICQDVRCWYYRYPHEVGDRLMCNRKDGDTCYALQGRNRFHSIFGGMKCGANSCSKGCVAATDISAYMEQLRAGNADAAVEIIFRVNPMPAITGRVCAHPCQDVCNQNDNGEPVAIRNVERYLGDYALANAERFYKAPTRETGKRVAVVGSGPSGLAAAYYLRDAGNDVTVYDSKDEAGGMLMYAIPNYRLPKDLVRKYIKALEGMGIKFVCGTRIGDAILPASLEKDFDSVYYATGTWKRPVLGLAGEELTVFGLDFLIQVHDWMDGKVGQEVLVTGGGNVAMDVAITARRLGAKKVTLACLETEDIMPAGKAEIARAREEGIEIMPGWGLSKVVSENGKVRGMELVCCTSVYDEKNRFKPVYDEDEKTVVNAENILMAVGQIVDLSFLDEKYQLQLNERGLIDVEEETQMTSRKGVFAGGDATTGPSTVIQCITKGHNAARGMDLYLENVAEKQGEFLQGSAFLTFDMEGIQKTTGLKLKEIPVEERSIDIEDEIAPAASAAFDEARRCQNCGCYSVAPSDLAPALIALDATIITTDRTLSAREFCCTEMKVLDVLQKGELITAIEIPVLNGAVMRYDKLRLRKSIDWAIVSLASLFVMEAGKVKTAKLVLGGVAPLPVCLTAAEEYLAGKSIDDETVESVMRQAVEQCIPMWENTYKIEQVKALIKQALLRL